MPLSRESFLKGPTGGLKVSGPIQLIGRDDPIHVRELSGLEMIELEGRRYKRAGQSLLLDYANDDLNWTVACLCDAQGNRLLTWKDWELAKGVPQTELASIATEAKAINGGSRKVIEDAAKNSESDQSSSSPSA